jgi:hypothetical protein
LRRESSPLEGIRRPERLHMYPAIRVIGEHLSIRVLVRLRHARIDKGRDRVAGDRNEGQI